MVVDTAHGWCGRFSLRCSSGFLFNLGNSGSSSQYWPALPEPESPRGCNSGRTTTQVAVVTAAAHRLQCFCGPAHSCSHTGSWLPVKHRDLQASPEPLREPALQGWLTTKEPSVAGKQRQRPGLQRPTGGGACPSGGDSVVAWLGCPHIHVRLEVPWKALGCRELSPAEVGPHALPETRMLGTRSWAVL